MENLARVLDTNCIMWHIIKSRGLRPLLLFRDIIMVYYEKTEV